MEYKDKKGKLELFKIIEDDSKEETSDTKSSDSEFKNSVAIEYPDVKMEKFDQLPQEDRENFKISKVVNIIPKMLFDGKLYKIMVGKQSKSIAIKIIPES